MRRMARVVLAIGCAALAGCEAGTAGITAPAPAAAAPSRGSDGEWVMGKVDVTFFFGTQVFDEFDFQVKERGRDGTLGSFWFRTRYVEPAGTSADIRVRGEILCATASGNRVRVGAVVRESNSAFIPVGEELTWSSTDNGNGNSRKSGDTSSQPLGADAEAYCALGLPYPEFPLVKGFVKIR